jgi:hypothetical protein
LLAQVVDNTEVGWEECTEAAMTSLLKTALAKNSKEAAAALPPLAPAKDTARLKKAGARHAPDQGGEASGREGAEGGLWRGAAVRVGR